MASKFSPPLPLPQQQWIGLEARVREVTGDMRNQLNHLETTCGKHADSLSHAPDVNEAKASCTDDQALNVVIHGVPENKASSIRRDVLRMFAGKDVGIEDAFRLRRFSPCKTRPLLVKLHSV